MSDSLAVSVAAGLAIGIGFVLLLILVFGKTSSSIPTVPALMEVQVIDMMKADIKNRVGDNVTVYLYLRDSHDPANVNRPLPLIYYDQEKNLLYFINGTSYTISSSCTPSLACFNIQNMDIAKSVAGRLVYFLDGSYSGEGKSAPAYYFIDAMNGEVVWSYIGEDIYPDLKK